MTNRLRGDKIIFWTFAGLKKDFLKALDLLGKTQADIFEPVMQKQINRANKIKNTPHLITD